MKRYVYVFAALVAIIGINSCKSQYEELLQSYDTDAKYAAAFEFFNNGKYDKAAQLFESLSVITTGTDRDDTVQFYWGLSNYNLRDYFTAETNFDSFISNFPRSVFADEAQFLRIDCLYRSTLRWELDQQMTYRAIRAISEYELSFPKSPNIPVCRKMVEELELRLDKKAYENAKIYYTMEDYRAARVALKNILKDDADNVYREDILYYTAMSSYKYALNSIPEKQKERYLVFVDDYYSFIGEYPDSKYNKELTALYNKVKK